jgi:hypothetical protein
LTDSAEPKLWRIETGQTAMRAMDVEAMCAVYRAPATLTRALAGLARQTKADGWWHSYGDVVPEQFSIYATLEEAACGLLGYASSQVPTLFRTAAYTRTLIMSTRPGIGDHIDQLVRSCLSRQTLVIRGNSPLPATVILRETLVRCPVGGAAVMAEQLRHLAEMAGLPNVCLRVLPFSAGMHPGLVTGSFTLLQFPPSGPESDAAVVHTAGLTGELFLDKPGEIRGYREAHATMLGCSLDETATRDLLCAAANELDQ